jgi:type II secretory pathway component PulM
MPPAPPKPPCPGSHDTDDDDYECPSPPSSNGGRHLVTPLVVTAFVVVFLFLASLSIYCFIRRRRRRRQQQSLLAAEAANAVVQGNGLDLADAEAGAPEDEVVHHAWHIRTVGLDEAAIESIALTRYRAGEEGTPGAAADCSVCLGEFLDGELLRLLPRCGHAFHVPCIGTWLRAHVNCPLCRADVVLDPAAARDPDAITDAAEHVSIDAETLDHEQPGQRQNEQQEVRLQIDQRDQVASPEPQRRRLRHFRRVVSMDSSVLSAGEVAEDKQSSKENRGNDDGSCCEVSSGSRRLNCMKRSLSGGGRWFLGSRHRRARSSLLPS